MPRPTAAPLVLSAGMALLALGLMTSNSFLLAGVVVLGIGLALWVGQLLPGRGHVHVRSRRHGRHRAKASSSSIPLRCDFSGWNCAPITLSRPTRVAKMPS